MKARSLVLLAALGAGLVGTNQPSERRQLYEREAFAMGTLVSLATRAATRAEGLSRLDRMLRVIEQTEAELSTWRADSAVTRLNGSAGGGPTTLSASLCTVMKALDDQVRVTGGAFDPAIGALSAAWDIHGRGRRPNRPSLEAARRASGWHGIEFDRQACRMEMPAGWRIDVGGFGKGVALDRVRDDIGPDPAWLIDFGGQVAVSDGADRIEWEIRLAHPQQRETSVATVTLATGSIAVSSGSERDLVVEGHRIGHILNPRSGRPASFSGAVAVWSTSATTADIWSTALYVMGPDDGLAWADHHDAAVVYLMDGVEHIKARRSRAFIRHFGALDFPD